jgi:hypothetical protein
MKLKGKVFLAAALLGATVLLLAAGCGNPLHVTADKSKPDSGDANIASRAVITDGTAFTATKNPFIYTSIGRNSSDPSAISVDVNGVQTILLVASSDLKYGTLPYKIDGKARDNYYPMDQTFLYAMSANGGDMTQWRDFGAILSEDKIDWAIKEHYDHLWAPDIQKVVTDGRGGRETNYWLFVPAFDKALSDIHGGGQRIAVARRPTDPFGAFAYTDYFRITGTDDFDNTPYVGYNGTMYDPGVFSLNEIQTSDTSTTGYMAWCSYYHPEGRIFMSTIPNMGTPTSGDYNGEIRFNNLVNYIGNPAADEHGHSTMYMEGPDIVRVPNNYGGPDILYLMFAVKDDDGLQEHIGYATMTPDAFKASPAGPWDFQGWVMRQTDPSPGYGETAEWTNQGSLVVQPDPARPGKSKYYLFYHYSEGDNGSNGQMRQIAMREITIDTDGLIQGVRHPSENNASPGYSNSLGHQEFPLGTSSISASIADDAFNDQYSVQPRIFINNRTNTDLGNYTAHYYFTADVGSRGAKKTPVLETIAGSWGLSVKLKNIVSDVWAVVMESSGLPVGTSMPMNFSGISFRLSYADGSVFDKTNDFSSPRGNSFTDTDRIAVYNENGQLVMGTAPEFKIISDYSPGSPRAITCTTASSGVANVTGEIFDSSWESQRWIIEPIYGSDYVRLKSCFTWLYLNYMNDSSMKYNCTGWADSWKQKFILNQIYQNNMGSISIYNYNQAGYKREVTYKETYNGKGAILNYPSVANYKQQKWRFSEVK